MLMGQKVRLELSNGGRDRRRGQRSSERILARDENPGERRRRKRSGSQVSLEWFQKLTATPLAINQSGTFLKTLISGRNIL